MIRFSLYLPDSLYEDFRKEAFDKRKTINGLILEKLGSSIDSLPKSVLVDRASEVQKYCKHSAMKGLCKYGCN